MTAILKLETKSENELDVKAALDELMTEVKSKSENDTKLVDRLDRIEAKMAHANDNNTVEVKSAGQQLVDTEEFKSFSESGKKARLTLSSKRSPPDQLP